MKKNKNNVYILNTYYSIDIIYIDVEVQEKKKIAPPLSFTQYVLTLHLLLLYLLHILVFNRNFSHIVLQLLSPRFLREHSKDARKQTQMFNNNAHFSLTSLLFVLHSCYKIAITSAFFNSQMFIRQMRTRTVVIAMCHYS